MRKMVKLRVVGNRLGLGSWSVPFAQGKRGYERKRQSKSYCSMASAVAKEPEPGSPPSSSGVAAANGY